MKRIFILSALIILSVFNSCKKDDDTRLPQIFLLELGHDNEKIGYIGDDLHVEAEITAPERIAELRVKIHAINGEGWGFDSVYTEYTGLRNTLFHKDIEIPEDAVEGHYIFLMKITDQKGRFTDVEEQIELQHGEGHEH